MLVYAEYIRMGVKRGSETAARLNVLPKSEAWMLLRTSLLVSAHLQQILGVTDYFRGYIKLYAEICNPMTNLTRKVCTFLLDTGAFERQQCLGPVSGPGEGAPLAPGIIVDHSVGAPLLHVCQR